MEATSTTDASGSSFNPADDVLVRLKQARRARKILFLRLAMFVLAVLMVQGTPWDTQVSVLACAALLAWPDPLIECAIRLGLVRTSFWLTLCSVPHDALSDLLASALCNAASALVRDPDPDAQR